MSHNTKISGDKKIKDWIKLRSEIDNNPNDDNLWEKAFNEFLYNRIETRYLNPIKEINKKFNYQGEGFSIVTLQCALIEFLETTITGETYKYSNPNPKNFEYNKSKLKFINFLEKRFPFNKIFDSDLATRFYENVRCGLLHEAQTKVSWLIRVDNKRNLIENRSNGTIVFDRIKFQELLEIFFKRYKEDLKKNNNLKNALKRKINSICRLPITS